MTSPLLRPRSQGPAFDRVVMQVLDNAEGLGAGVMTEYQYDPLGFFEDILNVPKKSMTWTDYGTGTYGRHTWDGTPEPFRVAAEAVAEWKDVGIESGTATGKTFWAACLVLWFLGCFENAKVITMAPKAGQLKENLWKEIDKLWPPFAARFPAAWKGDLAVRMMPDTPKLWTATGFPVGVGAAEDIAQKAKGFHETHMMFIFEEGPGIPFPVLTAVEETCRAPHNLRVVLGNPDHQGDALHVFCEDPNVVPIRISCLDHPNVVMDNPDLIPGAVSARSVEKTRNKHGDNGRLYLTQVRGISPAEDKDSLVSMSWLRRAAAKTPQETDLLLKGDPALGVDVADSPKGDKGVVAQGQGAVLRKLLVHSMREDFDASHLGADVARIMEADKIPSGAVGVDSVGNGVSSINKLKELGFKVQGLNGGSRAPILPGEEAFFNLRAAMYWKLREDLRLDRLSIVLPDEVAQDLFNQLTLIRWMTHNKTIRVEEKDMIRKRLGGASPDLADAVVYWNWAREIRGFASGLSANDIIF